MGVPLDKAGHQGHAVGLDHFGAGGFKLTELGGDGTDALAFDQHVGRVRSGTGAIPNARVTN